MKKKIVYKNRISSSSAFYTWSIAIAIILILKLLTQTNLYD